VFAYLDAFDGERAEVEALKAHYRRGGLADRVLKERLARRLDELLAPIRARRAALEARRGDVAELLEEGTKAARTRVAQVMGDVREVFRLQRNVRRAS
jgi:tryptophanyl-tRNA synthetase